MEIDFRVQIDELTIINTMGITIDNLILTVNNVEQDLTYNEDGWGDNYYLTDYITVDTDDITNITFTLTGVDLVFEDDIEVEIYDWGSQEYIVLNFIKSENGKQLVFNENMSSEMNYQTLNIPFSSLIPTPQPPIVGLPFVNLYQVDNDNLNIIKDFTVTELVPMVNEYVTQVQSYSDYIMGLYRYPFTITDDDIEVPILLGNRNSGGFGVNLTKYVKHFDFGRIFIPNPITSGSIGFKNVTVELFIPSLEKIVLDTDEMLGSTIHISMEVNLLDGSTTVNIISEKTGYLVMSKRGVIGEKIPYILNQAVETDYSNSLIQNGIYTPFVEIKMLVPSNSTSLELIPRVNLGGNLYFMKSLDTVLNISATSDELDEINNLLSRGVFYNG